MKLGEAFVEIRPDTGGFAGSLRTQLSGALRAVGGPAGALALGLGAGIAVGVAKGISSLVDFDKTISAVGAVSGATTGQLERLRQKAIELGRDTAFSAGEAAGALEALSKAGVDVGGILGGAADAAVALAAAGDVGLQEAAEQAATAMNSFGLAARQLPAVADLIAGAANASAIEVTDFGLSLKQVGAVANLAGISFADTAVAIAQLGQAGIRGSDAGTSLRTFLLNLQPVTERQISLFRELGIVTEDGANRFFDAAGKTRSLADISEVLREALEGQTKQQKLANLEILFGSDSIRAAAILAEQGAKGFSAVADAMGKISAEDVAAKRLDNMAGSLEQLKGSAETFAIAALTRATPALRAMVDQATRGINFLTEGVRGAGPLADVLADIGDAAIEVGRAFGSVAREVAPMAKALAMTAGIAAVATLKALAAVLEPLARFFAENESAARALAIAIGLLVARAALLRAGLALLRLETFIRGLATAGTQAVVTAGSVGRLAAAIRGLTLGGAIAGLTVLGNRLAFNKGQADGLANRIVAGAKNSKDALAEVREELERQIATRRKGISQDIGPIHLFSSNDARKAADAVDALRGREKDLIAQVAADARGATAERKSALEELGHVVSTEAAKQAAASRQSTEAIKAQAEAAKEFAKAFNTAFTDSTSIVAAFGNETDATKIKVKAFFNEQVDAARHWSENLVALAKSGLDEGLIRELAAAGPKAAGLVQALLTAVKEGNTAFINSSLAELGRLQGTTLDAVNAAFAPAAPVAKAAGTNIGANLGVGIRLGMMRQIPGIVGAVGTVIQLAQQAAARKAEAKSPSELFARTIGGPISQGIAAGIHREAAGVVAAAEAVIRDAARVPGVDARIGSPPTLGSAAGGATGSRGGLTIEHLEVTGAADPDQTATAIARRFRAEIFLVGEGPT